MEKHKCKLCFRSFSNGRALGGHMRSHMMNLPVPPKDDHKLCLEATESASSHSQHHFRDEEEEEEEEESLYYGLRENPKRSIKLVDPQFSIILQDRESETESSKNPTRRRSKRARKPDGVFNYHPDHLQYHDHQVNKTESWAEPEPESSISDATTEEDVAFCLMMMSRDNWKKKYDRELEREFEEEEDDDEEDEESEFEEEEEQRQQQTLKCPKIISNGRNNKYKCDTCDKVFRSYQALGGHRASHKKIKLAALELTNNELKIRSQTNNAEKKVHQCPVCFRVFASGQALGGHKRSHVLVASSETATATKPTVKAATTATASPVAVVVDTRPSNKANNGESLIDLNLPAPDFDDDDENDNDDEDCDDYNEEISQFELSTVSDAEFCNNAIIRQ